MKNFEVISTGRDSVCQGSRSEHCILLLSGVNTNFSYAFKDREKVLKSHSRKTKSSLDIFFEAIGNRKMGMLNRLCPPPTFISSFFTS